MSSPVSSTVVLPAIETRTALVLHLPSSSTLTRKYPCTFPSCTKSYKKPCRLDEHLRSHTNQRPYTCETCSKSYLRQSHLAAHARSHLPPSARPFICPDDGCEKRFWTDQHLKVHISSQHAKGGLQLNCPHTPCAYTTPKHTKLASHIALVHSPPGTKPKPFSCPHPSCQKAFSTSQKLNVHSRVHNEKRYTCTHPSCLPSPSAAHTYYPTWTSLLAHTRLVHPPTCPYPACQNRTFATKAGLRGHLRVHEEREVEGQLNDAVQDEDGGGEGKRKRRRGGDVGREWVCEVEGCAKDFKSKKALDTHTKITHLRLRPYACSHELCTETFGYKHVLQRHVVKVHHHAQSSSSSDSEGVVDSDEDDDSDEDEEPAKKKVRLDIDTITGHAYALRASAALASSKAIECPWPDRATFLPRSSPSSSGGSSCAYVFTRAYDLRRHLRSEHGCEVEKDVVDQWVRSVKGKVK